MGGGRGQAESLLREVSEERDGQRLDNFLARECGKAPRALLYRLIRSGQVRVNGKRAKADTRLVAGDVLRLPPLLHGINKKRAARAQHSPPPTLDMRVLFEGEGLLAVDKPAGIAVHGGSGVSFGVIERLRQTRGDKYLELAHRLDRDTSGVLLLATKPSALRAAQKLWRERKVNKIYNAAVFGVWRREHRRIELPLRKERRADGARMAKVGEDGAEAVTVTRLLRQFPDAALLSARIVTGRTHQIRAHCAAAGLPIIGDGKYGDFAKNREVFADMPSLRRLFLHARELSFELPDAGEIRIESPLPEVFAELEQRLSNFKPPPFGRGQGAGTQL